VPAWTDNDGKVHPCGRGVLTPACNAAAMVDKWIFTVPHMCVISLPLPMHYYV
jgi:hypothetical protein